MDSCLTYDSASGISYNSPVDWSLQKVSDVTPSEHGFVAKLGELNNSSVEYIYYANVDYDHLTGTGASG